MQRAFTPNALNPNPNHHGDHPIRGAAYIIGAAAAFSTMAVLIRYLSGRLPDGMLVFWRSLFSLLFLTPLLLKLSVTHLKSERMHLHVIRAVTGLMSMYCLFFALGHLPIAEATLLNQTATLFVPFIALLWLQEPVPLKVRWAIAIGFTGVLLVLPPGRGIVSWVALIGLASGFTAAMSVVTIRYSSRTEPTTRIVFYFCLYATLGSALPLPWIWVTPTWDELPLLVAMGALAALGQLLMTKGYSLAPAAQIGPFGYGNIVFGVLAGWTLWGETPRLLFWLGGALIVLGGITALRGELLLRPAARTPAGTGAPGST